MNGNKRVCKKEAAFKTLLPEKQNASAATTTGPAHNMLHVDSGIATQSKRRSIDDKRKTEKAENVLHLICWGPTWS